MGIWEGKKYKLTTSENFDEYMKALGVGIVLRKMGNSLSPTCELTKDGDEYTLTTSSTFKTSVMKFKVGVEFDEETIDGRNVKSVCVFDGDNKLVQDQKGEKPTKIIREFTDTDMTATMDIANIKCIRHYKVV